MKILFAVSLLAIIAAAALAFMTRGKFKEARAEKDSINAEILRIHDRARAINEKTSADWKIWEETQTSAKNEDITKKGLERTTGMEDDKLKQLMKDIEEIQRQRAEMETKIKDAIQGAGATPEEIVAKVKELTGIADALAAELETLKKDMGLAKAAADVADAESGRFKAIQDARERTISLTGRTATVLEANQEFSFVVLNIGRASGLTSDSRLLVRRGGTHIANLKIVSMEANRTIADIELKTVRPGAQVLAGDNVVVETSVQ